MPLTPFAALRNCHRYGKISGVASTDQEIFQRECLQPYPRRSIWCIARIVLAPVGVLGRRAHFNLYPLG